MKILVIEDDPTTGSYVAEGLRQEGHSTDLLDDGRDGLIRAQTCAYDVIVLDRMLPGLDGIGVIQTLRATGNATPVLFLTALDGVDDRINGLNAGGDDYLVKPFAFGELSARIAALARRPKVQAEMVTLTARDLEIDLLTRRVTRGGVEIDPLPREFSLLEHLLRRKGRVQTRTMLLEQVWDLRFDPQTNVVETLVSRLRAKVDKPFDADLIETVRGAGYRNQGLTLGARSVSLDPFSLVAGAGGTFHAGQPGLVQRQLFRGPGRDRTVDPRHAGSGNGRGSVPLPTRLHWPRWSMRRRGQPTRGLKF